MIHCKVLGNFAPSRSDAGSVCFAVILASAPPGPGGHAAIEFQRLKSFGFPEVAAAGPSGPLTRGSDGALYGTTAGGSGTVFKVNMDGRGYRILHRFNPALGDGSEPLGGLLQGSDGALYG